MSHAPFAELIAAHALGALSGPDLAELAAHLRTGCAECEAALREYEDTLARMAATLATPPSADVRERLLARLPATPATRRPRRWLGVALPVALAAGVALVAVGLVRGRYEARLAERVRETLVLRGELAATEELRALVDVPGTQVVVLAGLAPSPEAHGRVVWHRERGGTFVARGLPPAPAGKVYELWMIAGGTPAPAGLFVVDARGRGSVRVAARGDVPRVDQFAVTLEPAGGVPSPTGAMYLASAPST